MYRKESEHGIGFGIYIGRLVKTPTGVSTVLEGQLIAGGRFETVCCEI